jgi:hypothetical protein
MLRTLQTATAVVASTSRLDGNAGNSVGRVGTLIFFLSGTSHVLTAIFDHVTPSPATWSFREHSSALRAGKFWQELSLRPEDKFNYAITFWSFGQKVPRMTNLP